MTESLLPTGETIETSRLQRDFLWLEVSPPHAPESAFKALVPKSFQAVPPPPETGGESAPLVTVASLQASDSGAGILIQKQAMPREIVAAHWLRILARQTGRRIEILDAVSAWFAEAKVDFEIEGIPWSGRLAIQIAGGDAYILLCYAPQSAYHGLAESFGAFVGTWELLAPPRQPSVERWLDHSLGPFGFRLPASWRKSNEKGSDTPGGEAMVFANLDDDGELNGFIRIAISPISSTLSRLGGLEDTFNFWASIDLPGHQLISQTAPGSAVPWVLESSLKVLKLEGSAAPPGGFEGRLLAMRLQDRWLTISLLGPPEADAERFHVWAINHRAFKIAAESLTKH